MRRAALIGALTLMSACASSPSADRSALEARADLTPTQPWQRGESRVTDSATSPAAETTPHAGDVAEISRWWRHFDDPLLATLIDDAQTTSPTLVQAVARMREARAQVVSVGADRMPSLALGVDATRGNQNGFNAATQGSAGFQARWEADLFGRVRHQHDAAVSRAEASRMAWHDARVSLAAEVARAYVDLRGCEALAAVLDVAATSQRKTAELTAQKVRVGFEAPANLALADAGAADASNRLLAQRADCDALTLQLSVLTGRNTAALNEALTPRRAQLPQPGRAFDVDRVPATVLAHRPDIAAAELAYAAAESEVDAARASRWPQLSFTGSIGLGFVNVGGQRSDGTSWSIGPSLSLPIFDGGRIAAGIDAARARREGAHAALDQSIRLAVREIEEALLRLESARARESDALRAAKGFREFFEAAELRWRIGAGSLLDMEEARRLALNAQSALLGLQRERVASWVALYRAVGGGWRVENTGVDADALPPAPARAARSRHPRD